jgi:hypothetical protein
MFAFGRTIACVAAACDPPDTETRDGLAETLGSAAIMSRLTAQDPAQRLCAADALMHDFFAPAKESLKAMTAECSMCLGASCPCGRVGADAGVTCSLSQHFVCASCVEALVGQATQRGGDDNTANLSRLSDGKIHCPHCLAQQPRALCDYADSQLAKVLPASVFDGYLRARVQLLEDRRACELELEMQQRLKQARLVLCVFLCASFVCVCLFCACMCVCVCVCASMYVWLYV